METSIPGKRVKGAGIEGLKNELKNSELRNLKVTKNLEEARRRSEAG